MRPSDSASLTLAQLAIKVSGTTVSGGKARKAVGFTSSLSGSSSSVSASSSSATQPIAVKPITSAGQPLQDLVSASVAQYFLKLGRGPYYTLLAIMELSSL